MRPFRWLRRGLTLATLGAAGGALAITARHLLETPQPLESGMPGDGRLDREHGGDIYYTVAGPTTAPPLVLLHDFAPGASSYEYRQVFARLADAYRVYAPDWLGFGMSEHPALAYTGEFYAGMLGGFLRDVVRTPAILVGHGRAGNVAIRVATDQADLVERLVLISPDATSDLRLDPTVGQVVARLAQRTALGLLPYAVLSARPALRWQVARRGAPTSETTADVAALDHRYASAHQFGGQHAVLALLTGELDLPIHNAFALLEPPTLLLVGAHDAQATRDAIEDLAVLNPYADLVALPEATSALLERHPAVCAEAIREWASSPRQRHPVDAADRAQSDLADLATAEERDVAEQTHTTHDATDEVLAAPDDSTTAPPFAPAEVLDAPSAPVPPTLLAETPAAPPTAPADAEPLSEAPVTVQAEPPTEAPAESLPPLPRRGASGGGQSATRSAPSERARTAPRMPPRTTQPGGKSGGTERAKKAGGTERSGGTGASGKRRSRRRAPDA